MSWERDPLWAKARLFFEYAFENQREDPRFGLWSAMGLELLARAALASISPTLLAESDRDHKYLLQALNLGTEKGPRKSIGMVQVLSLCRSLVPHFSEEELGAAIALTNRRNDEVHSGASAFHEYTTQHWIAGFYKCCKVLAEFLNETLESLFGKDEAQIALEVLSQTEKDVRQAVLSTIAAHKKVFENFSTRKRTARVAAAEAHVQKLVHLRHHKVICPACGGAATVQGTAFGREQITQDDSKIVVKQAVSPNSFECGVCDLKLSGSAALRAAGVGNQYTRTTTFSPAEYYGMYDDDAVGELVELRVREMMQQDYDNE